MLNQFQNSAELTGKRLREAAYYGDINFLKQAIITHLDFELLNEQGPKSGKTTLHFAIDAEKSVSIEKRYMICLIILSRRADPTLKDNQGRDARAIAEAVGLNALLPVLEMIEMLRLPMTLVDHLFDAKKQICLDDQHPLVPLLLRLIKENDELFNNEFNQVIDQIGKCSVNFEGLVPYMQYTQLKDGKAFRQLYDYFNAAIREIIKQGGFGKDIMGFYSVIAWRQEHNLHSYPCAVLFLITYCLPLQIESVMVVAKQDFIVKAFDEEILISKEMCVHMLAVNRLPESSLDDIETWGPNAWMIDEINNKAYLSLCAFPRESALINNWLARDWDQKEIATVFDTTGKELSQADKSQFLSFVSVRNRVTIEDALQRSPEFDRECILETFREPIQVLEQFEQKYIDKAGELLRSLFQERCEENPEFKRILESVVGPQGRPAKPR